MLKRYWLICVVVFIIVFSANVSAVVELSLSHGEAINHPGNIAAMNFAERIKERTNGEVIITVHPGWELGSEGVAEEQIYMGTIDMIETGLALFERWVPVAGAIGGGGYLFDDKEHLLKVLHGPVGEKLKKSLLDQGMRILSYAWVGNRVLSTANTPVKTPKDLENILIRSPQAECNYETIKAMGATVTSIPFTELFMALMTGIVEGQENSASLFYANKFYEVQKYIILTDHIIESAVLVINEKSFNKIPDQYKEIFLEEGIRWGEELNQLIAEMEKEVLAELQKKGIIVIEPDRKAFKEQALQNLQPFYYKTLGKELYEEIREAAEN
jgi:tripartite ATP-independent transporter DctP family solute receptor